MGSLAAFLAHLDLEKYVGAFEALGATEVSHLADVDEDICAGLNLRPLEKKRLTRALQALNHSGSSTSSNATPEATTSNGNTTSAKRKGSEIVPTAKKPKTDPGDPCIFWLKGRRACKRGAACKHAHSRSDPKDEVRSPSYRTRPKERVIQCSQMQPFAASDGGRCCTTCVFLLAYEHMLPSPQVRAAAGRRLAACLPTS